MCENTCGRCTFWRHKSTANGQSFGICDNPKNDTNVLSIGLIMHITECDKETAEFIHNSIKYNENFGCIHFKKQS